MQAFENLKRSRFLGTGQYVDGVGYLTIKFCIPVRTLVRLSLCLPEDFPLGSERNRVFSLQHILLQVFPPLPRFHRNLYLCLYSLVVMKLLKVWVFVKEMCHGGQFLLDSRPRARAIPSAPAHGLYRPNYYE